MTERAEQGRRPPATRASSPGHHRRVALTTVHADALQQIAITLVFLLDNRAELVRRAGDRRNGAVFPELAELRRTDRGSDFLVETRDDVARRAGRGDDTFPAFHFVAR